MLKTSMSAEHSLEYLLQRVSIDHDNVMAHSSGAVTNGFNKQYGTNYLVSDLNSHKSIVEWSMALGKTEAEGWNIDRELWYTPPTLSNAEPMPGAVDFVDMLIIRRGFFIINSSRLPVFHESTLDWYKRNKPEIDPEFIYISEGDTVEATSSAKVSRIKRHKIRLHLEDFAHHAKRILDETEASVVLFSNSNELDSLGYGKRLIRFSNGKELPSLAQFNQKIGF